MYRVRWETVSDNSSDTYEAAVSTELGGQLGRNCQLYGAQRGRR